MDLDLPPDVGTALDRLALLAEPVRRRLFLYVLAAGHPVSRDEAAAAAGVGRPLAAFHLDRLTAGGLLVAEYRRPPGRRGGPGAGRPAKYYRPAPEDLELSLPVRRYRLAAEIFAASIERGVGEGAGAPSPQEAARAVGRGLAATLAPAPTGGGRSEFRAALAGLGYRPRQEEGGRIWLTNCPFDALVAHHRGVTCGTNAALLQGFVEGWGGCRYLVRLEPAPGRCCVVLDPVPGNGGPLPEDLPEDEGAARPVGGANPRR